MNSRKHIATTLMAVCGLAAVVGAIAIAETDKDAAPEGKPEMQLPPGWTEAEMHACVRAGTPGKMHKLLAKWSGTWHGRTTMWMAPDADPMTGDCIYTVTPIMEGRYLKGEMTGEMPGMGPYTGFGLTGFDNVSERFVSTWIDNHSTGMMNGIGELSADRKSIAWKYTVNCPVTGKPTVMREVETNTGPDTRTLEMFGTDPKSGKEYKMMHIEYTRQKDKTTASRE